MRTTIRLDDALFREAKEEATRSGMTLTEFIEEALRERLARRVGTAGQRARVRLKTVGGQGLRPGVDLDESSALLDLMNEVPSSLPPPSREATLER